jgi:hypothetical protein
MPFNPTLPLANSEIESAVLRDQFNGLNDLINARVTPGQLDAAIATTAVNPTSVGPFSGGFSDPPTSGELWALVSWMEQIRTVLTRT